MKQPSSLIKQQLGTILALVISISALVVSIYQANIQKAQQRAMVWPYVTINPSFSSSGFSFIATNNGTGPALIRSMEVRYQGQLITHYDSLLNRIKPDRQIGYDYIRMSNLNQTVMKAGEERVLFNMPWNEETKAMAFDMQHTELTIQYCSVLEDCWVFSTTNGKPQNGEFVAELEFKH